MKISILYKKLSNTSWASKRALRRALSLVFLSSLFSPPQGSAMLSLGNDEQGTELQISSNVQLAVPQITHIRIELNSDVQLFVNQITCDKWTDIIIKKGARISPLTIYLGSDPRSSVTIEEGVLNYEGTRPVILGSDIIVISIPGQKILYDYLVQCNLSKFKPEDVPNNNRD